MTYKILCIKLKWRRRALKQISKIPSSYGKLIGSTVKELASWPAATDTLDITRLKNHAYDYRLRVGRYRVSFDVRAELRVMSIEQVKKRDERTY